MIPDTMRSIPVPKRIPRPTRYRQWQRPQHIAIATTWTLVVALCFATGVSPAARAAALVNAPPIAAGTTGVAGGFVNSDMANIALMGVGSVRLDLSWGSLQPTEGVYDAPALAALDAKVNAAYDNGVSLLAIVDYAPPWATGKTLAETNATHPYPMPSKVAAYGQFATDMASRYQGKINGFEIWNEPNLSGFSGGNPDVNRYVTMFSAAYNGIKSASPTVSIITGGTAPDTDVLIDPARGPVDDNYKDMAPITFINGLYSAKAQGLLTFDAVGMHPYPLWTGSSVVTDFQNDSWSARYAIEHVRTTMVNAGDSAKKIWFTEFGAPTVLPNGCTESQQDAKISNGITYFRGLGYGGPIFIYSYRDRLTGDPDVESNFGVLRSDNSQKPSWFTLDTMSP